MSALLRDYEPGWPKVLLIGPAGSGKTLLATTLGPRALVLDLNNGLASAKTFQDKFTAQRLLCEVKPVWDAVEPDAIWTRTVRYVQDFCKQPTHKALVVDSLSDLTDAALGAVLKAGGKWSEDKSGKTTQADWGTAITQVERLLYRLRSIGAVLVMTAHTKTKVIDGDEVETIGVYGSNLPKSIEKMFDEVWYTKVVGYGEKRRFLLQTITTGGVRCKTRRQLPDGSDMNEGMDALLKKIGWEWGSPGV